MEFPPLIEGRFLRRYKRFFADFLLEDGSVVTAHCPNPGSMKSIVDQPEVRGWLSRARPGRKLAYTWEVALLGTGSSEVRCFVNPVATNRVVAEAITSRRIPELNHYDLLQSEVRYGKSRIDFLLTGSTGNAYVEVKNVTLSLGHGRAAFPDSVTTRGTKHLHELAAIVASGHRALLFFCVARSDARSVEAASLIDPVYAEALSEAVQKGVEILAYSGPIDQQRFQLEQPVALHSPHQQLSR